MLLTVAADDAGAAATTLHDHHLRVHLRRLDADVSVLAVHTDLDPDELALLLHAHPTAEVVLDDEDPRVQPAATTSVDFEFDDDPAPCSSCPGWWADRVVDASGRLVLREWHEPHCPVVESWE